MIARLVPAEVQRKAGDRASPSGIASALGLSMPQVASLLVHAGARLRDDEYEKVAGQLRLAMTHPDPPAGFIEAAVLALGHAPVPMDKVRLLDLAECEAGDLMRPQWRAAFHRWWQAVQAAPLSQTELQSLRESRFAIISEMPANQRRVRVGRNVIDYVPPALSAAFTTKLDDIAENE